MSFALIKLANRSVAAFAATLMIHSSAYAETHIVEIKSFKFTPSKLVIQPGDVVVWKNLDIVPHTATDLNKAWDTGYIAAGDSVTLEYDELISGDYFCEYHPAMSAELETAK